MSDMNKTTKPVTSHMLRTILTFIPVVNFIAAFLFLFAGTDEESKNYGKGNLIGLIIVYVLAIIFCLVASSIFFGMIKSFLLQS